MSAWGNILHWAIQAASSEAAKKAELLAVQHATDQLAKALQQHAPGVAPALAPLLDQVAHGAVAGILSKNIQ